MDGENRLYNPYSVLSSLSKGKFGNYWFETGTPTFLMDFVKNNKGTNVLFKSTPTISGDFPNFNLEKLDFTTLLLQTGYLTIKNIQTIIGEEDTYELTIPNREVNKSLFKSILNEYTDLDTGDFKGLEKKILKSLIKLDNDSLQEAFDILLSTIPSILYGKIKEDIREPNFHMLFLALFRYLGFEVLGETPFSRGTPDIILNKDNLVVVIEFKYSLENDLNVLANDAINQIREKEYYKPFLDYDVVLLGVAFGERELKIQIEPLEK